MNKIGLFSFIKDEIDFIVPFIEYHKNIFDSITIIDSGSTDGTLEILQQYSNLNIIKLIYGTFEFSAKGEICTKTMKDSDCDLLVGMDADEKMIFDDSINRETDPKKIKNYLKTLNITGHKYKLNHIYEYHPDNDGWYGICGHTKIIFPKKTFLYTDGGFHRGRTVLDEPSNFDFDPHYWRTMFFNPNITDKITNINISYLHYHFKSKDIWLKNTQKKLKARLKDKWDDLKFLNSYIGPSIHCKNRYLKYIQTNEWNCCKKNIYLGKDL